ncbi:MAG TPA: glycoside hydrolase family 3 N-terminal domain-containing protein [Gammaproteobacteria bacterium]|nr:glycoside hydrolase family 3 N-terminal domain-containing protein [Gammaproteobacteria bacterium]
MRARRVPDGFSRARGLARAVALGALLAAGAAGAQNPPYKDAKLPVEQRVADLVARMTLEEKVAQLVSVWLDKTQVFDADLRFDAAKAQAKFPNGLGTFARPSDARGAVSPRLARGRTPAETVELVNAIQRWAVTQTRLGIPVWFHEESLHGYAALHATMFPQAIAMASAWDPGLTRRINAVIAREVRARGVQQVLSPVVDVARDPRWGRIEETFGEDPYLAGELGVATVQGLQGDGVLLGTSPLRADKAGLPPDRVFATLKHMTGHGQPESGTNVGPSPISERTLRENFFPPFEQVVKRTGIAAVMPSYNEIDGIPSHANRWLLTDVLRDEWGFKGAIVSDYFAIDQLVSIHHVAPDQSAAAIRALRAGVDSDLPDGGSFATLVASVRAGRVEEALVDAALRRLLELKFRAGLFERPYADAKRAEAITGNAEAAQLALEAARKSIVLLKNDGVLPLDAKSGKTIAVIGPNAAVARLGGYSNEPRHVVTPLDGIRAKGVRVVTAQGVAITENDDWWADEVKLADPARNRELIAAAVEVARGADTIVLAIGDTEQTSREGWADNHLGDRDSLDLVGQQNELADALFALGKPTVVVLINGRPLSAVNVAAKANALVEAWYLGQEGGTALADVLFGDVNPGGKLPVTIARSVGQLPVFYNAKPSARRGYLFDTTAPLFPFGYGLSYTTFEIGAPRLSPAQVAKDGTATVSVDVRNSGKRAGDETVQLYVHDEVSSVTRPTKELKGFQRVTLGPGEQKTVTFTLGPEALQFWNAEMQRVVEPGEFDVMAGPNSVDLKTATLTVVE